MILRQPRRTDGGPARQRDERPPTRGLAGRHSRGHGRELPSAAAAWPLHYLAPTLPADNGPATLPADADEVVRLQELLRQASEESRSDQAAGAQQMLEPLIGSLRDADGATLRSVITAVARNPQAAGALADLASAGQLSSLIEQGRHVRGLQRMKAIVADPASSAADLRQALLQQWWTLGGHYIAADLLAAIPGLDDLDLHVRRYDNVLHLVKLRAANVPDLVVKDRGQYLAGPQVHEAVAQAMYTLRELDRNSEAISVNLQIDCHRGFATVVIGHPRYLAPEKQEAVAQAIRTYNSHLGRVEVITWDDLVGGAELSLAMSPGPVMELEAAPQI